MPPGRGIGNSKFLRPIYNVSSGNPPVNTVAPVLSGLNMVGETLTTTDGTWLGSTPQTLTRQFQRSTDGGTTWINVGNYISEALNTWAATQASVGSGTTNPTFFASNFKLEETATSGEHYIQSPANYMPTTNTYQFSIVAKAAEREWVYVFIYDSPEANGKGAWFNLTTGQIGTIQSGITAQITNLGSGWFQCTVSRLVNGDINDVGGIATATADNTISHAGTLGSGVFITGAKIYTGNLSTYVPVSADTGNLIRSYVYSTNSLGVASSASSNSLLIVSMNLVNLQSYDASKFTLSGSKITTWADQDGTKSTWVQSNNARRPDLVSGVPVFPGSGSFMQRNSGDLSLQTFSLYMVLSNTGKTVQPAITSKITSGNWINYLTGSINTTSEKVSGRFGQTGNRNIVIHIKRTGTTVKYYCNQRNVLINNNTLGSTEAIEIGAIMGLPWNTGWSIPGPCLAFSISDSYHTDAQSLDVINSLYNFYNLQSDTDIDTVIAIGDSNTVGSGSTSYLNGLATQLSLGRINLGISGSGMSPTFGTPGTSIFSRQDQLITRPGTDYICMMAGTNEILNGVPASEYEYYYNIVMTNLQAGGQNMSRVCLIPPGYQRDNAYASQLDALNAVVLDMATTYGTKYFDLLAWMRANGGNSLLVDTVHFNQTCQDGLQAGVYAALTS